MMQASWMGNPFSTVLLDPLVVSSSKSETYPGFPADVPEYREPLMSSSVQCLADSCN